MTPLRLLKEKQRNFKGVVFTLLNLYMERHDSRGLKISYKFVDSFNNVISLASHNFDEEAQLVYKDQKFRFSSYPKIIKKKSYAFRYPLSTKLKRTVGFPVFCNDDQYLYYYREAAKARTKGLKKNIGFTVFCAQDKSYLLFRVGFSNETSHYYCLYNDEEKLIAIIERLAARRDGCVARLYIENEDDVLISLLACAQKIITAIYSGPRDSFVDPSAGNYISVMEEEKVFFDRDFIERVKAQN